MRTQPLAGIVTANPSIKRTNNGGQRLRAFACAVPPLFAAYLQRYASRHDFGRN
jgi:hypothetical protein